MALLKKQSSSYGGELLKTRKGRAHARPLSTRYTMHLVLRSSKAVKEKSFLRPQNAKRIKAILEKFGARYGVQLINVANVGNHIHMQIKLAKRHLYKPYIRAVTSAIATAIIGNPRWMNKKSIYRQDHKDHSGRPNQNGLNARQINNQSLSKEFGKDNNQKTNQKLSTELDKNNELKPKKQKFWDYRPFTRIVASYKAFLNLKDYIFINKLEGWGYGRGLARYLIKSKRANPILEAPA